MDKRNFESNYSDLPPKMLNRELTEMMLLVSRNYKNVTNQLSEQHIMAIGRRYSMIADSYIPIAQIFYREPNSEEEQRYFNIYLNAIYINIFGIVDNLSWLIYFEYIYKEKKINKNEISIFRNKFRKICIEKNIDLEFIGKNSGEWYDELKKKRDPISHQIPLYVPYRVIRNEEQKNEYKEMENFANEKEKEGALREYVEIMENARKIGEFIPKIFLVDSVEETLKFLDFKYVINNDLIELNKIVRGVMTNTIKRES